MGIAVPFSVKYRPKSLSEVIGQPVVVKAFTNAFKYKTLHHAYILAGNLGSGKCVVGDTLIYTDKGLKYIKDIVPNKPGISQINYKVKDDEGWGISSFGYFENGAKTIKIKTKLGFEIEGTLDHPVKIFDKNRCTTVWTKIKDLKRGDIILLYRNGISRDICDNEINSNERDNLKDYIAEKTKFLPDMVECPICHKKFEQLNTHIKMHGLKLTEFRKKYGDNYSLHNSNFVKNNIMSSLKQVVLPKYATKKFARFLGYILSEGNIYGNGISFTNSDRNILIDYNNICKDIFKIKMQKTKDKRRNNLYSYRINSALLICFLQKLGGVIELSAKKFIPSIIFSWDNKLICNFLKALFEGDGGINGKSVSYYTISKKLSYEVQQLLLSLGIVSSRRIYNKKCTNCPKKYGHILYTVNISGRELKKFKLLINFISDRKRKLLNNITKNNRIAEDTIPYVVNKVYNSINDIPITRSGKIKIKHKYITVPKKPINFTVFAKSNKNISYDFLDKTIKYLEKLFKFMDNYNFVNDAKKIFNILTLCKIIYNNNYYYDKIISISNGESDVYDICKEGENHSFIANGIINHNTSTARILAAMENCEKGPTLEPCNKCNNCKEIFNGNSFDVRELDAASGGKIDDIRALRKEVYQSPVNCRVKYVIIDECLGGETRINTEKGLIPISRIVNSKISINVLSYNEKSKKTEYKPVTNWFKNSGKQLYKFIFETRGRLYASENHLIATPVGYKTVKELNIGDIVYREGKILTDYQKQFIYGSLLGDMSIQKNKEKNKILKNGTSARIKCVHGKKQKEYLLFKENILKDLIMTTEKSNIHIGFKGYKPITTYRFATVTDRCFSSIYNDVIIQKKKTINKKWLEKINWIGIAFWYMDDGSCKKYYVKSENKYKRFATFHTHCFSFEENKMLQEFFDHLGIKSNVIKDKKHSQYYLNITTKGTEILFKNISRYVPNHMRYKLYDFNGEEFNDDIVDNNTKDGVVIEKIIEKSSYRKEFFTYDIEVNDNHNYFASNTLVHNCHSLTREAAEASLKMIEEPPSRVRFILCTTNPQALKDTIHSRCILWKFNKVAWTDLFNHLKNISAKENIEYDDVALRMAAKTSKGSVRDSLQNLQTMINYVGKGKITEDVAKESLGIVDYVSYFNLMNNIIKEDIVGSFQIINDVLRDGKEVGIIIDDIYSYLDNLMKVKVCKNNLKYLAFNEEEEKRYTYQASKLLISSILKMMNLMGEICFGLEYNLDPQVLLNKFVVQAILIQKRVNKK